MDFNEFLEFVEKCLRKQIYLYRFRWHVRYSRQQFERYKVLFHEFDEDGGDLRPQKRAWRMAEVVVR